MKAVAVVRRDSIRRSTQLVTTLFMRRCVQGTRDTLPDCILCFVVLDVVVSEHRAVNEAWVRASIVSRERVAVVGVVAIESLANIFDIVVPSARRRAEEPERNDGARPSPLAMQRFSPTLSAALRRAP